MLPRDMKDPVEVAAWIESEYRNTLQQKCSVFPARSNRASELGHPCARYIVLDRTRGAEAKPPEPELQAIFELGKIVERETIAELIRELRLEWVWGQRPFDDPVLQISGMLDGGVEIGHREVIPAEIKGTQGSIFDSIRPGINGLRDMLYHKNWMVRKWIGQLIIYTHLTGERAALMVIRDKWFWRIRVVPVLAEMDIVQERLKELLARAEEVNAHIAAGTVPDRIEYVEAICGRCKLKQVCMPGVLGDGMDVVADDRIVELMHERDSLAEMAARYAEVDGAVKSALRSLGKEVIVGGLWLAKNSRHKRRKTKAPHEEYEVVVTRISKLDRPLQPLTPLEKNKEKEGNG